MGKCWEAIAAHQVVREEGLGPECGSERYMVGIEREEGQNFMVELAFEGGEPWSFSPGHYSI